LPTPVRPRRAIEEAVRLPGGLADFLLPHRADRIDAFAEFGGIDVLRNEIVDEALDAFLQLAAFGIVDRHKPDRLFRRHHRHRIGRGEHQALFCRGSIGSGRHRQISRTTGPILGANAAAFKCVIQITRNSCAFRVGVTRITSN
jgi:hypothetical protein